MWSSGLKNRFKDIDRQIWQGWHACLFCGRNGWDALHHIISPSSGFYVAGDHNRSILNSCPIHNYPCHVGNEGTLFQEETTKDLLQKTYEALEWQDYLLNANDKQFLNIYSKLFLNIVQ